ncbi:MAG TPA: iron-sulfur cluster assembly protein [Verrucomicrobiae bacterium]|nr:iron-sulfur cluster assembly protein [Verrucomicrobiae bacterium]
MNPQGSTGQEGPSDFPGQTAVVDPPLTEQQVWDQLRNCYDPEIPLNIVDLGLIYDVALEGSRVDVKMTLTAPGCHLGGQIAGDVQSKLLALDQVEEANVELVWDPPWHQSMISVEGRRKLGLDPA